MWNCETERCEGASLEAVTTCYAHTVDTHKYKNTYSLLWVLNISKRVHLLEFRRLEGEFSKVKVPSTSPALEKLA